MITRRTHELVTRLRRFEGGHPGIMAVNIRIRTEGEIKLRINHGVLYLIDRVCYCDTLGVSPND